MNVEPSLIGGLVALALPWLLGSALVYLLLRPSGRWNHFIVIGQGYPVGILATTGTLYLWDLLGLPFSFWPIAGVLTLLAGVAIGYGRWKRGPGAYRHVAAPAAAWQKGLVIILLFLLAHRYLTLLQELTLRPLFPWDAWMNWAPKPVVWFHFGELVEWVSRAEWLTQSGDPALYTAGAGKAWKYPDAIPLVQLWGMLGLGTDDHSLIYYPWFILAVALGLAMYGHLRILDTSRTIAIIGVYLLLSLPFLNVHVALAGYGDLWVAVFFGCAVMALSAWHQERRGGYLILSLLLAVGCTQLKIPGLVMGGIVMATLLVVLASGNRAILTAACVALAIGIYVLLLGLELDLGSAGQLVLSFDGVSLPYLGRYDFEFHDVSDPLLNVLFVMINWNLAMYLVLPVIAGLLIYRGRCGLVLPELTAFLIAIAFVLFVYSFTNRYRFAEDYTQVNRALIYCLPPLLFLVTHVLGINAGKPGSPVVETSAGPAQDR